MRNRLKGVTLIETILYIGLFSVIIIIVLNFMLSTQEATQRTDIRSSLNRTSGFVSQHINYSFNKAISIDQNTSIFDNSQGLLALEFTEGNKQYTLSDSRIHFDGVPITPSSTSVTSFTLHPIYKGTDTIVGVKIDMDILSKKNPSITDTINLLLTLR